MTNEQLQQIDQARRYAEQDEYIVTRTHIRNLLAIIEQQRAEANANATTVCNVFAAFGAHYDDRLSPADNVRRLIQQQSESVPDGWKFVPAEIIDRFPEINPSNYSHDDVCNLNAWGVELVLTAAPEAQKS